ncbi:hypothetical protein POSPLADRAFT_1070430 [Postia placenta MAD-698-R-SB12]|uniref:Uncharacterized protein n=1 Tax=Postia placenta MAD-698-R-SB12 TaxID=670580 RepID=A0A1X6MWZ4_9APHY|nr:hypothetical protein POSPLADRAFT_1070430 [Postia placenta MAD-698-R-SB12]OSX60895.1 hypothetical protein POSPLADRAFT_1070430 [Postia placenta MAD-698-R-SB12]
MWGGNGAGQNAKLLQHKVLTFDVYGTLMDWETGILKALEPIVAGTSLKSKAEILDAFESVETELQARYPEMRYSELLARTHAELDARLHGKPRPPEPTAGGTEATVETDLKEAGSTSVGSSASAEGAGEVDPHTAFGQSIAQWPVFPDTIPALAYLSQHFKLTVLSNVDRASFSATQRVLGGPPEARNFAFTAVYTAEDAGAYKPDPKARAYALRRIEEDLGFKSHEVIVVANSVEADIAPSHKIGLATAWVNREGSVIGKNEVEGSRATFKFRSLGEMAEALRREVEGA